jgi:hypothetical protein
MQMRSCNSFYDWLLVMESLCNIITVWIKEVRAFEDNEELLCTLIYIVKSG